MKKNLLIIVLAVLLMVVTTVAALNVIAMGQIKKITPGTSHEDVVNILGEIKDSNSSGFVESEWWLANGATIRISFDYSEEMGESYVRGYFVE